MRSVARPSEGASGSYLTLLEWQLARGTRAQEEGICKVAILPRQSDIDLLAKLIDIRDSADLTGHTDDLFRQIDPQGEQSVVSGPGRTGLVVSKLTMRRLRDLGLFYIIDSGPTVCRFDLADDVRDRLEQMRLDVARLSGPQPQGVARGGQPGTGPQPRRPGRPKGTRSVTRDQIIDVFRTLRTNYGRAPTQVELAANLKPRIEIRTLQAHLDEYGLGWPIE
jgi:hypothetical protein